MNKKNKSLRKYKSCKICKGTGKIKLSLPKLNTPDCKRMLAIMRKHKWTQCDLAKAIGISQGTISDWFYHETNITGTIKTLYFSILKQKGFI